MFLRDGGAPGRDAAALDPPREVGPERRFFESLDGIRFIAAFLIVVHHAGFASGATFQYDLVGLFLARFDIGVSIFFVLSGFLLYRPYVAAQFANRPFTARSYFWTKRVARIYPAYWAAFIPQLALGAIGGVVGVMGFALSFGLLHVYVPSRVVSGITQSWSLATELGFYLMLPLLAQLARRWTATSRRTGSRTVNQQAFRLLGFCALLFPVSLAFRYVMAKVSPYHELSFGNASRVWTPSHLEVFGAGMALAVVSAWADVRTMIRTSTEAIARRPWVWWAASVVLFWFVTTQFDLERGLALSSPEREAIRQMLYLLVGVTALVPAVFAPPRSSPGLRLLASRPMAYLGLISYGIYLWHQAFIHWAQRATGEGDIGGNFFLLVAVGTAGAIVVSALSYRYVEEPISDWARVRFRR